MSSEEHGNTSEGEGEESTSKRETPQEKQEITLQQMEQLEEAKLKAKYPQAMRPGGSTLLQKRLNKGQKYFDSGDYNMAKAKGKARVPILQQPTGEAIPTPDNLPTRKMSHVQSKLAAGLS